MRINQFIAKYTTLSRRAADKLVNEGKVQINGRLAVLGAMVGDQDQIIINGRPLQKAREGLPVTVMLNKPIGYVCSRQGQGSKTVYDLLPKDLQHLKYIGRLDKDSSGLLMLTNDGQLLNQLTHPRYEKPKIYQIEIDSPLSKRDHQKIISTGVDIGDKRLSRFKLAASGKQQATSSKNKDSCHWQVTLSEGRNRQIRRTFESLGYKVLSLHRTHFGPYKLDNLPAGKFKKV